MSFSFVKNLSTMREVPKEFLQAPILKGDLLMDVVILDQYQQAILKVEEKNKNWWIPRFGLNESMEVEERLKEKFSQQFRKTFLQPLDRRMAERMAGNGGIHPCHGGPYHQPPCPSSGAPYQSVESSYEGQ